MRYIFEIVAASFGALGYSVLFNIRKDKIILSMIGAALCWSVYLIAASFGVNTFFNNLIAAAFGTLYAEILARIKKAPTTCFLIPTVIPLIPGGGLFYTISALMNGNTGDFQTYLINTVESAFGISIGIMIMSLIGIRIIKKINNNPLTASLHLPINR